MAVVVLAAVGAYWSTGRMDPALSQVGLNADDCVQNGFGATFCGDAAQRMLRQQAREKEAEARQAARKRQEAKTRAANEATYGDYDEGYAQEEAYDEDPAPTSGEKQESSDGTRQCGAPDRGWTLSVGRTTSCELGRAVREEIRSYQTENVLHYGEGFTVEARSSVTGETYEMACSTNAGVAGAQVLCSGGAGAMVNFSRYQ